MKHLFAHALAFFAVALLATNWPCKLLAQAPIINTFRPAIGAVGTLVTVSGTNLTAPTAFTIGGATAIIVSNDGSTLVGMVMPGAVTGAISLTTAAGTAIGGTNFTVTATSYPSVQQGAKLVGTGAVGPYYPNRGRSVAVSADGNTAIVGGQGDNTGQGAVWVYTRSGSTWAQQGSKLVGTGNTGSAFQGNSVSISADGNTILAGGPGDNSNQGAAWVYTRSGGTWTQQGPKLVGAGNAGAAGQGQSVSLSADGNTAILGGYNDNSGVGAAWVYTRSGGSWAQQGSKLVGTGADSIAYQGASVSLSADGNTAIVGGDQDNSWQGAAWVYTRSGGSWAQQGSKLVGTGAVGNYVAQGCSVSLSADGNTAIVGGADDNNFQGAAWVYTRSGGTWAQQGSKLVGTGGSGYRIQGYSVSLSADGNTAIVGGPGDNPYQGGTWIYTRSVGTWIQQGSELVGTGAVGDYVEQGSSISLSADGNTAIVGGIGDNGGSYNVGGEGAAWVFVSLPAPTVQATNVTFTNTSSTATTASWTNGNGASRAVFMLAGVSGSPAPANSTAYSANAAFGSGDQIGSTGWYCVYNGTGNTVNITGLTTGTTYRVMVIEYKGTGGSTRYLINQSAGNPASVTALSSNANLIGLSISAGILTPAFTTATISYTISVANAVISLTVTPKSADALATIKINGTTVSSGTASGSIPLNVGTNMITTIVTAQNGTTTKIYTVTVTRAGSNNANLTALKLVNPITAKTTVVGPDAGDYTASVNNATASIEVIPATAVNTSTVKVNGVTVASGSASSPITLNVGPNTITTIVTAQNGVTTKTYTVTVTRSPSNNANLSALRLVNPTTAKTTVSGQDAGDYTASVSNAATSIGVIPTTAVTTSAVKVNGMTVVSGSASNPISLNVGSNTITTIVTAQDGLTTKTYVITVTRAAPGMNIVYDAVSVSSPTDHPQMMGEEINVHTGLSPNGDGINDFLLIDSIARYPDNKLQIMNRSGQLIFEAIGYDNSTRVFDGHSNKNGVMQLPGTYFYSLAYNLNGVVKHKTGFIVLKY